MSARRTGCMAALLLCALASAVAVGIALSGGLLWRHGFIRISLRQPFIPVIVALLSALAAWTLSSSGERRCAGAAIRRSLRGERLASNAALLTAIAIAALGLFKGSFAAGGADAYGYVSQADLWARGQLVVKQPFARAMTWPDVPATLAPLGYRPRSAATADLVPVYSPGLPIVMAIFKMIAGRRGVFLVVPLFGALAVWSTFVMGRRFGGPLVGAASSVLLAADPSFLIEVTSPTSDVPATAWWAAAFALLSGSTASSALGAGLAASFAVLTRPNLVPLLVFPAALLLWQAREKRDRASRNRALMFASGALVGPLVVAVLNSYLYGSPASSGYGSLDHIYSWSFLAANLARYPRWLFEAQTPIVLVAFAAPFLRRESIDTAVMWLSFGVGVLGCYLFYRPFDEWVYLRFLLPALPPLLVLAVFALTRLAAPLARVVPALPALAVIAITAATARYTLDYALDRGVMLLWRAEQRYVAVGEYIAAKLPENAALLSMQHSGSARYYSGRLTVRYDVLPPGELDRVIGELGRLGYTPYLLLDDWEEPLFRERFKGRSVRAGLDWWPVAMTTGNHVKIYDPADRVAGQPDRQRTPDLVP